MWELVNVAQRTDGSIAGGCMNGGWCKEGGAGARSRAGF